MDKEEHTYSDLMFAAQMALLGEVEPSFRGVAVEWENSMIIIYFYINGIVTDELQDACLTISAEVVASYSEAGITEKIIRIDYPANLPTHGHWVFRAKEKNYKKTNQIPESQNIFLNLLYVLLGNISPNFRGIAVKTNKNKTDIYIYVDGKLNKEDTETILSIEKEAIALTKKPIELHTKRIDFPQRFPSHELNWVYRRSEPFEDPKDY